MAEDISVAIRDSEIQGLGVFVQRAVAAGEVALAVKGKITSTRSTSSFQISRSQHLETSSVARFINHSCEPSSYLRPTSDKSVEIVALFDLDDGDEITLDYGMFEDERQDGPIPCVCGKENCRGFVLGYRELSRIQQAAIKTYVLPYLLLDPGTDPSD